MSLVRELIKNSNLSINEVMYKVGYQDTTYFSSLFKKQHGTTPRQYRTTVRPKIFNIE
jgi:YesN/AraC family two-component response regulator